VSQNMLHDVARVIVVLRDDDADAGEEVRHCSVVEVYATSARSCGVTFM
jgi:hypothetical protein